MEQTDLDLHWIVFKNALLQKYAVVRDNLDKQVRTDAELKAYLAKNRADVIKDVDDWLSLMD